MPIVFNERTYNSLEDLFEGLVPTIEKYKNDYLVSMKILIDILESINSIIHNKHKIIKKFYVDIIQSLFKNTILNNDNSIRTIIEGILIDPTNRRRPEPLIFLDDYSEDESEDSDDESESEDEDESDSDVSEEDNQDETIDMVSMIYGIDGYRESDFDSESDDESDDEIDNTRNKEKLIVGTIINPEIDYTCVITGEDCSKIGGYIINKHKECEPKVIISDDGFNQFIEKATKCIYCREPFKNLNFSKVVISSSSGE